MQARGIGDNSAAYGQELRADIETVLSDDHEATFRYAQWHIGDYITGTMGMQLEQEGAYIRFLMRLYQRGKPLPDDDRFMAMAMNLSIRVWKRVKDGLIAVGKIIAKAGYLTNSRFEKERQIRAETMRKQAEAARTRWQNERQAKGGLDKVSGKFAGNLDETSPKLQQSTRKKPSKINEPVVTDHMLTNNQEPLTNKVNGSLVTTHSPPRGSESDGVCVEGSAPVGGRHPSPGGLTITDEEIRGPGFVLDLKACELEVDMCGLPISQTKSLAEVIARDWVANKVKPRFPSTAFRNALVTRRNRKAIEEVQLSEGMKRATQSSDSAKINAAYERMMARRKEASQ